MAAVWVDLCDAIKTRSSKWGRVHGPAARLAAASSGAAVIVERWRRVVCRVQIAEDASTSCPLVAEVDVAGGAH